MEFAVGQRGRIARVVTDADTAPALGSGDVPVLATPRLLAWAEAATVAAVADVLDATSTTVGSRVELEHRAASPVGATVTVEAEIVAIDGRLLHFAIVAADADGGTVASGEVVRVVVDRNRFLERLQTPVVERG
jgi:fluoroacetyl-CoA thioesterase